MHAWISGNTGHSYLYPSSETTNSSIVNLTSSTFILVTKMWFGQVQVLPVSIFFHMRFAKQAERRSFSCCNFQFKTAHTYSLPPAAFSGLTYTMKHAAKYHSLMICILSSLCTSSMLHTSSCGCLYEGRRFSTTVTWWSCRRTQCHLITFSIWCIPWWA